MNLTHSPPSSSRHLPESMPGFEVDLAVSRMFDNTDLWWRVLAIFHEHHINWIETWEASQAEQTFEPERKCVHALRSSAANVGALRLADAAGLLESLLMERNPCLAQLAAFRHQVGQCFNEVQQAAAEALTTDWRTSKHVK